MNDMKKLFAILLLAAAALSAPAQGYSELFEGESTALLRSEVAFFCSDSIASRGAGSLAEGICADHIAAKFSEFGLELLNSEKDRSFGLLQDGGDTLKSRNVVAVIPGFDRKLRERYIVIGARMDEGNASGLAVLEGLAQTLSTNRAILGRSVVLAAFGAASKENAGSWYFLNRSFPDVDKIDAMVNLDRLGLAGTAFYAYTSSNADLNAGILALESTLQPMRPEIIAAEPFPSEHRSFYGKEIPSVMFSSGTCPDFNYRKDTPADYQYDYMARVQEYLYNYTVRLSEAAAPVMYPDRDLAERQKQSRTVAYYDCDKRPSFFGGSDPAWFLRKWVYVYLKYPDYARENGIQGRVQISFTIDDKGKVGDVTVTRGVHPSLDDEAVRVISASPDWKPGILDGKRVKSSMSVYVDFRLERKKKR